MASFSYLFHPSTNMHSVYTPIFTILAILLAEHLYVALRLVVRSTLSQLPSWSDIMIRKEEFELKKIWLHRILANHKAKRATIDPVPKTDLTLDKDDPCANSLWSSELNPDEVGVQLIQNAFKMN
ncbi:hypothetical protein BX666DRAFT_605252 [Dichotomocladium elegans]|nr:hypothetical protein BX666DRAFT_605252 [Dichotomocladium elegans]